MSASELVAPEASTESPNPDPSTSVPAPVGDGWTFVALIAHDGSEPPAALGDREALGT
jgi:hypothetical protein